MKVMVKTLLFSFTVVLILSSCNIKSTSEVSSSSSVVMTSETLEGTRKSASDSGINLEKDKVYFPKILAKLNDLSGIKFSKSKDDFVKFEYNTPNSTENSTYQVSGTASKSNIIDGYEINTIVINHLSDEDKAKMASGIAESKLYKRYENDGKIYYIAGSYNSNFSYYLINMMYDVNNDTGCFVSANLPGVKDLNDKIAEKIYEDFKCVPLSSFISK